MQRVVDPPPAQAALLRDSLVLDDGLVVTAAGALVEESLINQRRAIRFGNLYRPLPTARVAVSEVPVEAAELPGDAVHVLLKQRWDSNYGHWLVESLPRLAMVREMAELARCRFLVRQPASAAMRRVCLDSLALFGIAEAQVIFVGNAALAVPELLYPAPLTVQPWVKAPLAIRTLEEMAARAGAAPASAGTAAGRIYVSRNAYQAERRRLLNEAELLPILEARGYVTIHPEQLSLREQMLAFASAGMVVGNMGAALSNLVFSPPGVRVFVLATEGMMDDFFYDIVCHKQGAYWSLHGRAEQPELGMQSDFTLDPARFAALLDAFEAGC